MLTASFRKSAFNYKQKLTPMKKSQSILYLITIFTIFVSQALPDQGI